MNTVETIISVIEQHGGETISKEFLLTILAPYVYVENCEMINAKMEGKIEMLKEINQTK